MPPIEVRREDRDRRVANNFRKLAPCTSRATYSYRTTTNFHFVSYFLTIDCFVQHIPASIAILTNSFVYVLRFDISIRCTLLSNFPRTLTRTFLHRVLTQLLDIMITKRNCGKLSKRETCPRIKQR